MSFKSITDEFPLKRGSGDRFRYDCDQSAWINKLVPNNSKVAGGACYNLCYWFACLRLLEDPNGFKEFSNDTMLEGAIRNQGWEDFKVDSKNLRIESHDVKIIERNFGTAFCLFRYNITLNLSLIHI